MTATILEGKEFAARIKGEVSRQLAALKVESGITPGLAVIIVGENPASKVYVANKHKACEAIGIYSEVITMPENTTKERLLAEISRLNNDDSIHGILVQLPLPDHIRNDEPEIMNSISPDKDVDGFHPVNVGKLAIGEEHLVPCTPHGCIKMLELAGIEITGKRAVVIGRSNIVGKPMFHLLLARNATVTVCHSRTQDLADITRQADILVAAVGKPKFVTKDMVKPGAVVIDVGINRVADKKLVGDVDFDQVKEVAGAITPVPGGVGLLTIAMLLHNTVKAAAVLNKR
ncbi:MAG: bifunctional methylenetetrahydrofolate dehydrogenase/methenyltetrahydrofolate cyclohydrolase FolD [Veillonellaceae bacterium]|jgi:methylenetetrahydrofolate dehydrogenase (NADP+)/methenyltetrahydrofolate cyclohydrolase|nr:bifunctional methylenetetrahydrofolate dehydrogenase/methenyltetrahydrofolate cyclohydrolase FolD [Veillonellaceae bacterium]